MALLERIQNALQSTPRNVPSLTAAAIAFKEMGRVGKSNVQLFRHWSEHSEWIRAAINIRKNQVGSAEWDIVQNDPDGKPADQGLARELRDRLDYANPKAENFQAFLEQLVEDILVLDAGSIEKVRSFNDEVVYLYNVDGGTVRVNALWDGEDEDEPRYFWYPDNFERARWKNRDFIYIVETPRANSAVGLSKLETLKLSIDAEIEGHAYNARQVRNPAPDGLLHLGKGARQEQVDSFKAFWQAEQGRGGAMAITGGTEAPNFIKFQDSNREAQFLEWQIYLVRKMAAVFQLSTQDMNLGYEINRSTAEVSDQQTEDRGIRPLMGLLRRNINQGYIWDESFGGRANNLAFKWTKLNLAESLKLAQYYKLALAGVPWTSINTALKEMGKEPLGPEFDKLIMSTPTGAVDVIDVPTGREFMDSKKPVAKPPKVGPGGG
jgi:phage portal protein BeeE